MSALARSSGVCSSSYSRPATAPAPRSCNGRGMAAGPLYAAARRADRKLGRRLAVAVAAAGRNPDGQLRPQAVATSCTDRSSAAEILASLTSSPKGGSPKAGQNEPHERLRVAVDVDEGQWRR